MNKVKMSINLLYSKVMRYMNVFLSFIVLSFLLSSFMFKENNHDRDKVITHVIENFSKSYKSQFRKNDFFSIRALDSREGEFYIFNISSLDNKVILSLDGEAFYPVDYKTYDDKIFFIDGEITYTPNAKVFDVLKKHKLIDSTNYNLSLGLIQLKDLKFGNGTELLDEKKKIITYVVCKKSNKIISNWITNKSNVSDRKMKKAIKKGCN